MGDVVRETRDERAGSEALDLREREVHDALKAGLADEVARLLRRELGEQVAERARHAAADGHENHGNADGEDLPEAFVGSEGEHAVVDDLRHEHGLNEVGARIAEHEENREGCERKIWLKVLPHRRLAFWSGDGLAVSEASALRVGAPITRAGWPACGLASQLAGGLASLRVGRPLFEQLSGPAGGPPAILPP